MRSARRRRPVSRRKSAFVRTLRAVVGMFAVAAVLFVSNDARAQQAPRTPARQEVADNIAPHPAPEQPIPYSHKTHLALGLQCQMCHTNPDPGNQMTFPATRTCMTCHANVAKDKPSIMKLADYNNSGQPVPWVRVYQITPGVTWTHRKHLQAGMQCTMCHGDVSKLDAMAQTTSVTAMGSCIGCHQAQKAPTSCVTCHSWPAEQQAVR
jgi:Cytochrome c7 and related cytochrome c/Class III cytochrome C family